MMKYPASGAGLPATLLDLNLLIPLHFTKVINGESIYK